MRAGVRPCTQMYTWQSLSSQYKNEQKADVTHMITCAWPNGSGVYTYIAYVSVRAWSNGGGVYTYIAYVSVRV